MEAATAEHLADTRKGRRHLSKKFTLRMLGQNVQFSGWNWLALYDELAEGSELRPRIVALLAGPCDLEVQS